LTCGPTREPKEPGELSATDAAQLVVAGKRRDKRKLPISARIGRVAPPDTLLSCLELVAIHDAGGAHVYDAVLHSADSGTVFHAGTTRIAADLIQGSPEGRSAALNEGLENALARRRDRPGA
jgi:hypothetical protein